MCNAGLFDRIFRGVAGFGLIVSALYGFVWGWLGLVLLVTSFIGFCPLYALIGLIPAVKRLNLRANCRH